MKILNWMQNKIIGKQASKRCSIARNVNTRHAMVDIGKEELGDWPHGLLAIGTLGNYQFKEAIGRHESSETSHPLYDMPELTMPELTNDEFSKLQLEIDKLLQLKPSEVEGGDALDKLLITLEPDPKKSSADCGKTTGETVGSMRVVGGNGIRQKSMSFLLKKMFACHGGHPQVPTLPESRMEKLLKTILQRKIYPQSSIRTPPMKSLRPCQQGHKAQGDEEMRDQEKSKEGCKWVKTDSDFIVLEI